LIILFSLFAILERSEEIECSCPSKENLTIDIPRVFMGHAHITNSIT